MNKKFVIVLLVGIFILSFISAIPPVTQVQNFPEGYIIADAKQYDLKLNEDYTYHFFLYNASNGVVITNASVECQFFSADHNGIIVTSGNISYDTTGKYWYYFISKDNYSTSGYYSFGVNCQNTDAGGALASYFYVTPTGHSFETSLAILYGFILLLIGLCLYFSINGIVKSTKGVWMIAYVCLTYLLLYLLLGFVYLMSKSYLYSTIIFEKIFYILWFVMGIGFLPFVIIVTLYILGQEAKAVLTKNYVNQGYSRDEADEMSKKHK